jgi:HK97 family phage portal protein
MKLPFFSKRAPAMEQKANPVGRLLMLGLPGLRKERNLDQYITEGYIQNAVVYRCIREIASAFGSVKIEVRSGDETLDSHPAAKLLAKPNPGEGCAQFLEHCITDYLISGNLFVTKNDGGGKPAELWALSPRHMNVVAGNAGLPQRYEYKTGSGQKNFTVDQISGKSDVFHFKTYNPLDPFIGLSPMRHIALPADVHNSGLTWNNALLENGARPSGLVTFEGNPSNETIAGVREYFKKALQGAKNAGEIPMLIDGAKWQEMGSNPKDMDFATTMSAMTKYIASAFGVPLPLVDNDAASYNNMEQAKERFWTDTVLPLLNKFLEAFGTWLLPQFGDGLSFWYDPDSIPALEASRQRRADKNAKLVSSGLITPNEARDELGYDAVDGADELLVSSSMVPLSAMAEMPAPTDPQAAAKMLALVGYTEADIKALLNGKD